MSFRSWIVPLFLVALGLLVQTGCGGANATLPKTATEIEQENDPANMEVPPP